MNEKANTVRKLSDRRNWPTLSNFPLPAKALVSATILVMGIALLGALGQIIVHDLIPTFFTEKGLPGHTGHESQMSDPNKEEHSDRSPSGRDDLFGNLPPADEENTLQPFYKKDQFIWLLKWSHIHLFGMSMIFIFMGAIVVFLNIGTRIRTWLVVLPFAGVLMDITAMWLKTYVSQIFFWLHIPGGGLFIGIYLMVSAKALMEMWRYPSRG